MKDPQSEKNPSGKGGGSVGGEAERKADSDPRPLPRGGADNETVGFPAQKADSLPDIGKSDSALARALFRGGRRAPGSLLAGESISRIFLSAFLRESDSVVLYLQDQGIPLDLEKDRYLPPSPGASDPMIDRVLRDRL